jgi:hypothetical protein
MNIKKYFIASLFVMGVAAASFAQDNNNDSLNQSSPDMNRVENSDEPELNSDGTEDNSYDDNASGNSTIPGKNEGDGNVNQDSIYDENGNASSSSRTHTNSPADNSKDAKYYGDSATSKKMKSSQNKKSTGNNANGNTSASAKKESGGSYQGSPNPDAVER